MAKLKHQYIGPKQVATIEDSPDAHIAVVRFIDGTFEEYERTTLEGLLDKAPYDLTTLRERMIRPVAAAILELLLHYGVRIEDVQYLNDTIVGSLNRSLDKADGKLWKRDGEAARDIHAKTIRDVDRILKA